MNSNDRELLKTLSDLTADVRAIKEQNHDIKQNQTDQQRQITAIDKIVTKLESNQPKKYHWSIPVAGTSAAVVLGLNAPALLAALQRGLGT